MKIFRWFLWGSAGVFFVMANWSGYVAVKQADYRWLDGAVLEYVVCLLLIGVGFLTKGIR